MNLLRGSNRSRFAVMLMSFVIVNARSRNGAETSAEYLQNVMIELQELNMPANNPTTHDRLSADYHSAADYQDDRIHDNTRRKLGINIAHQDAQGPTAIAPFVKHADVIPSAGNNVVQYYAVRDPAAAQVSHPKVKQPEPLAFTRAELAALYKKALEKGSAISVASLTQALNAAGNGNAPPSSPQIGHLQLPLKYPMYNYYFFPLKSFASELQRDHQQVAAVPAFAATETAAESTDKQLLMNPLFVAIGTFVSMALLFMMGVLFLPKLPHFELFNARRADNDDFLRLTTFVLNAIDARNRWRNFSAS